jgi:dTDP-4-dehydrorhamnose reductase
MRVLIIGATGLLGKVLVEEWTGDEVAGVGSRDVDIRERLPLQRVFAQTRPEWTVLAAAYTDVDGCEESPDLAMQVNCVGALNVALAARDAASRLLFLSTDYVFDGAKSAPYETGDAVNPLNVYGRSKAEAEKGIREILPHCCILRTSWLFGALGRCFPNSILHAAESRKRLAVVADQTGSPTHNRDLARIIMQLVHTDAQGILHASNTGACTWHEFACEVIQAAGLGEVSVEAIHTDDLPRQAQRPKYSVLSVESLKQYGLRVRPWRATLPDYFSDREAAMQMRQHVASLQRRPERTST